MSKVFGLAEGKLAEVMQRTKGNLEIDFLQEIDGKYILGQAKAQDYSGVKAIGGFGGNKQFFDTIDLASALGKEGKNVEVAYYFQNDVSEGLVQDLINAALQRGVNLTIKIQR